MKKIAMIPARIGSTRLKMKNLALIDGKPMIYYAIKAAKESDAFDRVIINSDSDVFFDIAERYDVDFYKRPEYLGGSNIKSDDVVADFIKNNECDIVAWVNPTSPLQTGIEITNVVKYFIENNLDSLITVEKKQVHSIYNDKPLNFNFEDIFAQTQDLIPVYNFVYSVMMWRSSIFTDEYTKKGKAFFSGTFGFYPVSKETGLIIKTEEDLRVVDYLMKSKNETTELKYDSIVDGI